MAAAALRHLKGPHRRMHFRIGVNLGNVNVAARLEALAASLSDAYDFYSWLLSDSSSVPLTITLGKAKEAADKAVQLDKTLTEAHCALGVVIENFFDWIGPKASSTKLSPSILITHLRTTNTGYACSARTL